MHAKFHYLLRRRTDRKGWVMRLWRSFTFGSRLTFQILLSCCNRRLLQMQRLRQRPFWRPRSVLLQGRNFVIMSSSSIVESFLLRNGVRNQTVRISVSWPMSTNWPAHWAWAALRVPHRGRAGATADMPFLLLFGLFGANVATNPPITESEGVSHSISNVWPA